MKNKNRKGHKSQVTSHKLFMCLRRAGVICFLLSVFCYLFSVICLGIDYAGAEEKNTYDDAGRRDPFMPLVTRDGRLINFEPENSNKKLNLEGIIYDKQGNSFAVINGEVVGVGDFFQNHAVFKVKENSVILLENKELIEYKLNKEEQVE